MQDWIGGGVSLPKPCVMAVLAVAMLGSTYKTQGYSLTVENDDLDVCVCLCVHSYLPPACLSVCLSVCISLILRALGC